MMMTRSAFHVLTLSTILAFSPLLAACDNDDPQTPQKESALEMEPNAADVAAIEPAAGQVVDDFSALPESSTSGMDMGTIVPQDDQGGNSGPEDSVLPDQIPDADIPPPPNREVFSDNSCDFEAWVGKPVDEAAIKKLNRPSRVIKPGDPVTMDHNPMRVNVEHDKGVVTRVWCG